MAQNWTSKIKVFISPKLETKSSYQNELSKLNIPVYRGTIKNVNHTNTKVKSVSLESGEKIDVDMLLWIPPKRLPPLIQRLVENLSLELDEQGFVKTDIMQQTSVKGLFAAGDVHGSMGALAAHYGGIAAISIVHEWFH
jgi:thioredoxin reductase